LLRRRPVGIGDGRDSVIGFMDAAGRAEGKAAPTKKNTHQFEIFMVLKIFGKRFLTLPKQARDSFPKSD